MRCFAGEQVALPGHLRWLIRERRIKVKLRIILSRLFAFQGARNEPRAEI